MGIQTFIVVRNAAGHEIGRVETTGCWWCAENGVCASCHAKAIAIRVGNAEAAR